MALQIAANNAAQEGVNLHGRAEVVQPAMTPGMGAGEVPGLVVFNVMVHGHGGQGLVQ